MHNAAIAIYLILGLVEFYVVNKAVRVWLDLRGLMALLLASFAAYLPIVGGAIAFIAAITVLDWPWWLSGVLFIGGTAALALTGGPDALLGNVPLF